MIFKLKKIDVDYIKEYANDAFSLIKSVSESNTLCTFCVDSYTDFTAQLNYAVLGVGMDDEDTVNEVGKRLYSIIDDIVAQKHSA
jgi:hypothetical protein